MYILYQYRRIRIFDKKVRMSSENGCIASRTKTWSGNCENDEGEKAVANTPGKKMKVVGDAELEEVAAYVKKH